MSRQRKIHPQVVYYEKFNKEFQMVVGKAMRNHGVRGFGSTRTRKQIKLMGLPNESVPLWHLKQKVRGHNN